MATHIEKHTWGYEAARQLVDLSRPEQPYVHRWWTSDGMGSSVAQEGELAFCFTFMADEHRRLGSLSPAVLGLE